MVTRAKVILWLFIVGLPITTTKTKTPRVFIPGNITIGGLMVMTTPDETSNCSVVNSAIGIEGLEALLFAVDRINANKTFLPNITFGVKAFDTCGSETAALDRAVKVFVLGGARNSGSSNGGQCTEKARPVFGVIGPTFSYEAEQITPFLNLFGIPLISYSATSPTLSDKSKYEYFSRTASSDDFVTQAITDLLVYFNWTYVSVVYSDETYGRNGYEGLKQKASKKGIYFANENKKLPFIYDKQKYKTIAQDILSNPLTTVIVLFSLRKTMDPFMTELQQQLRGNRKFQLIGTEILATQIAQHSAKVQKITKHAIFFSPPKTSLKDFDDYFMNLSPQTNTRNPWFKDFFQQNMKCSFAENTSDGATDESICDPSLTLRAANFSSFLGKNSLMPLVVDGVYAFAHALRGILQDRCTNDSSDRCVPLHKIRGKEVLRAIRKQTFRSPSGNVVNFSSNGDVTGTYDVYYFGEARRYEAFNVGKWRNHKLNFLASEWKEQFAPLPSSCAKVCGLNEIRRETAGKPRLCWDCDACPSDSFPINETTCHNCSPGHLPDRKLRTCIKIKVIYFTLDGKSVSLYIAVLPILLSIFGIGAICLVVFAFVKYRNTPLVKASSRELSCFLLLGLFLSFMFPFIAISKPSPVKCFCQFVLDSVPLTISYVAIAVKNNRIFRIFNPERVLTTQQLPMIRPKSQIIISLILISFQVFLLTALTFLQSPARDHLVYPSPTEVYQVCVLSETQVILSQTYNVILIIVCTYYAFKTRNIPRNFNEAKYIAFAMYGSCVVVLAFGVMFFMSPHVGSGHAVSDLVVRCFRSTFVATLLLLCFFGPKVYIILYKSEENINHATATNKCTPSSEQEQNDTRQSRNHTGPLIRIGVENLQAKKNESTSSCATQTD